jgi:hypothetical protein
MIQGSLPLLTKGPLALFYGGNQIINDLSEKSPGRGFLILVMCSAIFQIFLSILKQTKSRNLKTYLYNLTKSLVENVVNMYGIIASFIITIASVAYGLMHHWSIEKSLKQEQFTEIVPHEIYFLYILLLFITIVPFLKSYALR